MSLKVAAVVAGLLLALNLVVMTLEFASPSRAAVAGMNSRRLEADPDFVRAVHSIVEHCKVNVDLAQSSAESAGTPACGFLALRIRRRGSPVLRQIDGQRPARLRRA